MHPEILDEYGDLGGCPGVKSLALYAAYLNVGQPLVRAFFSSLGAAYEPSQVMPGTYGLPNETYNELVLNLITPSALTKERMDRYCRTPPTGDAAAE